MTHYEEIQNLITARVSDVAPYEKVSALSPQAFDGYDKTFICLRGGYVFLFHPYLPLVVDDPSLAFVDSYYRAFQRLYRKKKEITDVLIRADMECKNYGEAYKPLLTACGLGRELKNTLLALAPFGTFFCIEVLDTGFHDGTKSVEAPRSKCLACGKCASACPAGAIGAEGFKREQCLRQRQCRQIDPTENAEELKKLGNRVLGCNNCQFFCPENAEIAARYVTPDERYAELFDLDKLAVNCAAGMNRSLKNEYADYIGFNYVRPLKLLGFALNAMLNDGAENHFKTAAVCLESPNKDVRRLVNKFIELYKEKKNGRAAFNV